MTAFAIIAAFAIICWFFLSHVRLPTLTAFRKQFLRSLSQWVAVLALRLVCPLQIAKGYDDFCLGLLNLINFCIQKY